LAHLLHPVGPHHGGLHMGRRMALAGLAAREAGARIFGSAAGVSPQAGYSGEARAPKTIIQERKKGIRGSTIVFIRIQPVAGVFGEIRPGWRGRQRLNVPFARIPDGSYTCDDVSRPGAY
jgi:hypothetical protein